MKPKYFIILLFAVTVFGQVTTLNVTMKPGDFLNLYRRDIFSKDKLPASIEISGQGTDNAKIHFKGSTSPYFAKKPFKINFSKKITFPGVLFGIKEVNLNAMYTDKSFMREKVIWDMYADMGALGPKECGYAQMILNGKDRGMYMVLQDLNEDFLIENKLSGNLYKSHEEESGSPGLTEKSISSLKRYFKKDAGDEKDYSDLLSLVEKINNTSDADFAVSMHELFDMNAVYDWLVLNSVTQMGDTYDKNYYLFHDLTKSSQSWKIIPWDYDMSMGRDAVQDIPYPEDHLNDGFAYSYEPLAGPKNILKDRIIANPVLYGEYKERLRYVVENYFTEEKLFPKIDENYNLIQGFIQNEPDSWGTYSDFNNQVDALRYFITARRNYLLNEFLNTSGAENDIATVSPTQTDVPYNFVDGEGNLVATMRFSQLGGLQNITVKAYPLHDPPGISNTHIRRYLQITTSPRSTNFKAKLRWGYYGIFAGSLNEKASDIIDERWLAPVNYNGGWEQLSGEVNPYGNYVVIPDINNSNCGEGKYFALEENYSHSSEWSKIKNDFGTRYYDVKFADPQHGYICGDDGKILSTEDGGNTWKQGYCSIHLAMKKMAVMNNNTVIAIGEYGSIFRTVNSGVSWQNLNSKMPSADLHDILFTSQQNGYIAGDNGVIMLTNNSGNTWQSKTISGSGNLYSIVNTDENILVAAGENGKIFRSKDRGSTWNQVTSNTTRTINSMVIYHLQIWAAGNGGTVLVSNDMGETWEVVNVNTESDLLSVTTSDNEIYICGKEGLILKSPTGINWSRENTAGAYELQCIALTGSSGFAVGNSGTILTNK